jgi:hypothetical protein
MAGGRRPGSGAKKGVPHRRITPRERRILRTAELLSAEIEARKPPHGMRLGKDVLAEFTERCARIAERLWPAQDENGRLRWAFPGAAAEHAKWMDLTLKYAASAAPYQSPTFRALIVPPPERPSDDVQTITLKIFDHNNRLLPPPEPSPSAAPASRPPADVRPWPRPVPDAEPEDDSGPPTPPNWRR